MAVRLMHAASAGGGGPAIEAGGTHAVNVSTSSHTARWRMCHEQACKEMEGRLHTIASRRICPCACVCMRPPAGAASYSRPCPAASGISRGSTNWRGMRAPVSPTLVPHGQRALPMMPLPRNRISPHQERTTHSTTVDHWPPLRTSPPHKQPPVACVLGQLRDFRLAVAAAATAKVAAVAAANGILATSLLGGAAV